MRLAPALIAAVLLSGCATSKWMHPDLKGAPNEADIATMAQADCEAYAAGRAPAPTMTPYMPVPAANSYNATGTYQSYGSGGTFQGTMTPQGGFASGYAKGANMGANIANAYAQSAARARKEKVTAACMRTMGWVDANTPEGEARLKAASAK